MQHHGRKRVVQLLRTVDFVIVDLEKRGAHEKFEVGAGARLNVLENVLKRVGHDPAQLLVRGDALLDRVV
jgi:hypothetical protein